jgi:hypothetical protein
MEPTRLMTRDRAWNACVNGEVTPIEALILEWQWEFSSADSFRGLLWKTIAKADQGNRDKLVLAYPDEVTAVNLWRTTWIAGTLREKGLLN